jgi:hypothetical protein
MEFPFIEWGVGERQEQMWSKIFSISIGKTESWDALCIDNPVGEDSSMADGGHGGVRQVPRSCYSDTVLCRIHLQSWGRTCCSWKALCLMAPGWAPQRRMSKAQTDCGNCPLTTHLPQLQTEFAPWHHHKSAHAAAGKEGVGPSNGRVKAHLCMAFTGCQRKFFILGKREWLWLGL